MNQITNKIFDVSNLCYEAVISPVNKEWSTLTANDSKIPHLLQSVAFRVIFSIVSFLIFPIIISLAIKKGIDSTKEATLDAISATYETSNVQRVGLSNLLNTPYLNTVIQLLAGNQTLSSYIRTDKNKDSETIGTLFELIDKLRENSKDIESLQTKFCNLLCEEESFMTTLYGKCPNILTMLEFLFPNLSFGVEIKRSYLDTLQPDTLQAFLKNVAIETTSPIILITIDNPLKPKYNHVNEIVIGETTYKLSAVVRKPTLSTEVLFEPSVPGSKTGFTYADSEVTDSCETNYATALFYTKVEKKRKL